VPILYAKPVYIRSKSLALKPTLTELSLLNLCFLGPNVSSIVTDQTNPAPRVLPILFLGVLMAALDIAIVGPALPAIRETFGVDERSIAWVFNTFVLFNLVGLGLMAKLSDVLGRRLVYTVDVLLFGAGSLVVALSPSFTVLLVGRAMQGIAASGIFPVASAVIGDTFAPERRGRMLGVLGSVYGVAFIIGPMIGGILLQFGWTWLFLINIPLALVIALVGYRRLPAIRRPGSQQLDWSGIGLLSIMLGALAYGINQIDTTAFVESMTSRAVWPFLLISLFLLPVFIWNERRAADPLVRLSLFQNRQVVLAALMAGGAGMTEAAFIFFTALAIAAFGVSTSTASFMLLPLVFAVAIGSPLAGYILDRVGSRAIVLVGAACLTIGLAIIGLFPALKFAFYGGSIIIGFGLAALLGSALSYILLNEARAEERTVAQGISTLAIGVGQLMGGALIGAVAASGEGAVAGYAGAFLTIAAIALVLTLLALGLKKRASELQHGG